MTSLELTFRTSKLCKWGIHLNEWPSKRMSRLLSYLHPTSKLEGDCEETLPVGLYDAVMDWPSPGLLLPFSGQLQDHCILTSLKIFV